MKKSFLIFILLAIPLFSTTHAGFFGSSTTKDHGTAAYTTKWSSDGNFLAVGGENFSHDVTVYSWDGSYLNEKDNVLFGARVKSASWTSDGNYLAVGGNYSTYNLIVYSWNGQSLTLTDSAYHGTQANAVAWDPTDSYLAVGGDYNPYDLMIYSWDGSALTTLDTADFGTEVNGLDWHPDGDFLAVAGNNSTSDVTVYSWNGSALSSQETEDFGTQAYDLAWSHTGGCLAVVGYNSNNDLIVYHWTGADLHITDSAYHGTSGRSVSWSHDNRYVCVGGDNGDEDIAVYAFDGSTLTKAYSSLTSFGSGAYAVDFSPYSNYLAVAGDNSSSDLTVYDVDAYLNGRTQNITLDSHRLFNDGGSIKGLVRFENGLTILPTKTLILETYLPFSGGIDLRTSGILQLGGDLYLDPSVSFSSSGHIKGEGNAILLGGNMTIPADTVIHIASDTIIDGGNHTLTLDRWGQIFVDEAITLTLRNIKIANTLNGPGLPMLTCASTGTGGSKLALDNVILDMKDDFYFNRGQLYIHNDVVFTGTSQFVYRSPDQSFIAKDSTLSFEPNTTFFFDTTSSYTGET